MTRKPTPRRGRDPELADMERFSPSSTTSRRFRRTAPSLFPDRKTRTSLFAVKASVRKGEGIVDGPRQLERIEV